MILYSIISFKKTPCMRQSIRPDCKLYQNHYWYIEFLIEVARYHLYLFIDDGLLCPRARWSPSVHVLLLRSCQPPNGLQQTRWNFFGKTDQLIARWPPYMTNGTPHLSVWFACMAGKIEINANGTRLRSLARLACSTGQSATAYTPSWQYLHHRDRGRICLTSQISV